MTDDIVTRLRTSYNASLVAPELLPDEIEDMKEASDEIERLRELVNSMSQAQDGWGRIPRLEAEIERLRLLVEAWRSEALTWHHDCCHGKCDCIQVLDNNVREWIETHE